MASVGIGIDAGASLLKGVALRIQEDGSFTLLEALAAQSSDIGRVDELGSALTKHRSSPFSSPPTSVCFSGAEAVMDRLQLPIVSESAEISDSVVKEWIAEGKAPVPGALQPREDHWDFEIIRLYRRTTDAERFGGKCVDGRYARVPAAYVQTGLPIIKGLTPATFEPSTLALLNYVLRFAHQLPGQDALVVDIGHSKVDALFLSDTDLLHVFRAPIDDLTGLVAKAARLTPDQALQRLRNADLMATDAVDVAIRDAITKTLARIREQVNTSLGPANRKPTRALICGGMASLRGAVRLAHGGLDLPAEIISIPESLRAQTEFSTPYSAFLCAIGTALRAAGAAPVLLTPRKAPIRATEARAASRSSTKQTMAAAAAAMKRASPTEMAGQAANIIKEAGRSLADLPGRLGKTWATLGFFAMLAIVPTLYLWSRQGTAISHAQREIELLAPDYGELEREASLIRKYIDLTEKGALSLVPWGEVVTEITVMMPEGAFITGLNVNEERMLLIGRVKGSPSAGMRRVIDRLKQSPALKRRGLMPPDL